MPLHDPNLDTITDLQRSITATLTYLMGLASLAELFGIHAYLSTLASQMTQPDAGNQRAFSPMRAQQELSHATPARYRQEG